MARENRPQRRQEENDGLIKKLIEINRVSKTEGGDRRFDRLDLADGALH